jgi:hypothetical protein
MWHVGIHIVDVPPNEIEPNYDDYYSVSKCTLLRLHSINKSQVVMAFNLLNIPILPLVKASIILLLLRAGSVIEVSIRAPHLHNLGRIHPMVSLHLHLPAADW